MDSKFSLGVFPEKGGLLPFGFLSSTYFCLRTSGKPSQWVVYYIWQPEPGGYLKSASKFSDFLVRLVSRRVARKVFTLKWDPENDVSFVPRSYRYI